MKLLLSSCAILLIGLATSPPAPRPASALRQVARIPLENVEGRIDHFGIDVKGERLFMSALGNNTVEVFDLHANKRLHSIQGLHEPQGTTYAPDSNRIFVANGDDGAVRVFDGTSYKLLDSIRFSSDADDTRFDATTHRVYVGYGEGAVAAMDSASGKVLGEIKVSGHPEAYEVEKGGGRIFINVPDAHEIEVGDWERKQVVARWSTGEYSANFPMTVNPAEHRLFVVARHPAQLLVFDSDSGKMMAHVPVVGDSDDVWYDAKRKRVYISGGEGFVSVVAQRDADHYEVIEKIPTGSGARTSFYSPDLDRLCVAVPHRGSQRAELFVLAPEP